MIRIKTLVAILIGLAIFWVYAALMAPSGGSQGQATAITIRTEKGQVALSSLRGKVVLLDFWATWCGPCRMSIPAMGDLYNRYHEKGFEVLGVSVDRPDVSDKEVWEFGHGLHIPYLFGKGTSVEDMKRYQPASIPTMVLIDKRGEVRDREMGYSDETESHLAILIEKLLKE